MPEKKKTAKNPLPDEIKELVSSDAASLMERVKASNLNAVDREFLVRLIGFVLTVRALLEKRNFSLKALLRRMFGLKTERAAGGNTRPPPAGGGTSKPGHGRHSKDDYPGAQRVECKHETLKPGDECPACHKCKIEEAEAGVAYRWTGQAPLVLTLYILQRLLCQNCKTTFTASVPGEKCPTAGPTGDPVSRRPERSYDATANAMVAQLRYDYGVPHYRLAELQASQGVPLPAANQWKMVLSVYDPGQYVHAALEDVAAQGNLVQNDDTHMRVLSLERGWEFEIKDDEVEEKRASPEHPLAPPKINGEQKGRKGTTSGIYSLSNGKKIALYYTGTLTAGKNLAAILAKREDGLSPPIQMCDALRANLPPKFETLVANCLDHCRRKFHDVMRGFPAEVNIVLDSLRSVYEADAYAEEHGMSAEERLSYHQKHSGPVMEALFQWAEAQKRTDLCRTSGLGQAIKYMLKHWKKLTLFLRLAGAPIANSVVERLLKRAIRHRKNSMHYLNLRGARVGDVMMSLIQTCRLNGVGPFEYLTAIQRFASHVKKAAREWLPWNYTATMAKLLNTAQSGGP